VILGLGGAPLSKSRADSVPARFLQMAYFFPLSVFFLESEAPLGLRRPVFFLGISVRSSRFRCLSRIQVAPGAFHGLESYSAEERAHPPLEPFLVTDRFAVRLGDDRFCLFYSFRAPHVSRRGFV